MKKLSNFSPKENKTFSLSSSFTKTLQKIAKISENGETGDAMMKASENIHKGGLSPFILRKGKIIRRVGWS